VRSSTSNSDPRAATTALVALLAGLILYCAALELAARIGFSRASAIQRRVTHDLNVARALGPRSADGSESVLLVGNSLLLEGVDRATLRRGMSPRYATAVLPIENTQFDDWYFGARRLFAEGARPSVLVACLTARQMMSHTTDGEYFAHFLMRQRDLLAVRKESGLNNTMTSDYFFANYSAWLGSRSQIKNWLLHEVMPGLDRLVGLFPNPKPAMPEAEKVVGEVLPHLVALDEVCRARGVRLVVVVPPPVGSADATTEVREAAARKGIRVLVPMGSGEVPPEEFADGFHLNARGAARFTERLATTLTAALENSE
jgi:hypothetical protein